MGIPKEAGSEANNLWVRVNLPTCNSVRRVCLDAFVFLRCVLKQLKWLVLWA